MDFDDFGNEAAAGTTFEVHHDVYGITHIGLDGPVRQVHAALQYATREAGEALSRGRRMYRRKTAGVAGVQKLQEIEGLAASNFPEN